MKLRVLGGHGGALPGALPTCYQLSPRVLLDAGAATAALTLEEQYSVDHILLSQCHLDHFQGMGFLADNVIGFREGAFTVYGSRGAIDLLFEHYFNNKVWPDFTKIPTPDNPIMRFGAVDAERPFQIDGFKVELVSLDHPTPAAAYLVSREGQGTLAYVSDTGPTDRLWERLQQCADLTAILLHVGPTNSDPAGVRAAGRLSPKQLARELSQKFPRKGIPLLLAHTHPQREEEVRQKVRELLSDRPYRFLQEGDQVDLKDPLAIPAAEITSVHIAEPASSERTRRDDSLVIDAGGTDRQRQMFTRFGRTYRAGEVIFGEGDTTREMYIVQEGTVKLTKHIRGERRVIETISAGEFFGEMSILNAKPRSLTAEAATDVKLLIFPPDTFEGLIVSNAGLAHRIIRTLAGRLQNADNHIENLLYHDVESKLVNALLKLADVHGIPERGGVKLNITPSELAEQVGLTLEQTKKIIAALAQSGIVHLQRRALLIRDPAKLEKTLSLLGLRAELKIAW